MLMPKPRFHFSLIIFLICLLFTFRMWDFYFNSPIMFDRELMANCILLMGFLFSVAAGLFIWSIESRRDYLEKEVRQKTEELLQKTRETRQAEITSAAIYQSCHILFSEIHLRSLIDRKSVV